MKYKTIATIKRGMSKDIKKIVNMNGETFLLRKVVYSVEKLNHYKLLSLIKEEDINMSKLRYLYYDSYYIYAFFDYINGIVLEDCIRELSKKSAYNYGIQAGHILRQIHDNKILNNKLKSKTSNMKCVDIVIKNYRKINIKSSNTDAIFNMILHDISNTNINFDDYCYLNADFHYGNFILNKGKLFVVDLEKHEIGNRYRDFTFIYTYDENRTFALGIIDGYFDNNVSTDFWIQFKFFSALYLLQYYMWEYKRTGNHNNAEQIINCFLNDYDDDNLIPKCYVKEKKKCKNKDI